MSIKIPGNSLKLLALPRLPAWYGEQGLSVCLSVPSFDHSRGRRSVLLLSAVRAGFIDRQRRPSGTQQQRRRSTAPQHGAQQQMRAVSR